MDIFNVKLWPLYHRFSFQKATLFSLANYKYTPFSHTYGTHHHWKWTLNTDFLPFQPIYLILWPLSWSACQCQVSMTTCSVWVAPWGYLLRRGGKTGIQYVSAISVKTIPFPWFFFFFFAHTIIGNWPLTLIFYPFSPFTWFCGPYRDPHVSAKCQWQHVQFEWPLGGIYLEGEGRQVFNLPPPIKCGWDTGLKGIGRYNHRNWKVILEMEDCHQ